MTNVLTSQICKLEKLEEIFFILTEKNCNQRCHECYIKFPYTKNVKDFIKLDLIKQTLEETKTEDIKCIFLTGAEPMTHPDFNIILRLCLKRTNVCIITNATMINEKKARFLKKVEDESNYRLFLKLSFTHYDEIKNDAVKYRGAFRQNMHAIKYLDKYNLMSIVSISNYYEEKIDTLKNELEDKINKLNVHNYVIQTNNWHKTNTDNELEEICGNLDCMTSRTITNTGVFSCPFLSNDYRGRSGSNLNNYSKTTPLETEFCATCIKNKDRVFGFKVNE